MTIPEEELFPLEEVHELNAGTTKPLKRSSSEREEYSLTEADVKKRFPGVNMREFKKLAKNDASLGRKVGGKWYFPPNIVTEFFKPCRTKSSRTRKAASSACSEPLTESASEKALKLATSRAQNYSQPKKQRGSSGKAISEKKRKPQSATPTSNGRKIIPFAKASGTT